MGATRTGRLAGTLAVGSLLAACSSPLEPDAATTPAPPEPTRSVYAGEERLVTESRPPPWVTERTRPTPSPTPTAARPEPRTSFVTIPALGLRDVPVERYRGTPDDAPGTAIQDTGVMASPRGSGGLVGPGVVGNYLVTGHRTSHGAPLGDLPALDRGDRVRVRSGEQVFVYRVTGTRITSFRSPRSLREQSAAVPGRPGVEPRRPMLTLSTCRTPEDRAEGNYWSDQFGNPENRIDKIAVLESVRPARS
ncbi:class E sortase [Nocardioides aequoreus]|uniref:class E sortase n=1 Tax=Nocardioides aequoreus TaxID=397278 RepID=UPI000564C191|nr:class E sortase [Nocardioides aequoreus]